jgi:hypothetical protein
LALKLKIVSVEWFDRTDDASNLVPVGANAGAPQTWRQLIAPCE